MTKKEAIMTKSESAMDVSYLLEYGDWNNPLPKDAGLDFIDELSKQLKDDVQPGEVRHLVADGRVNNPNGIKPLDVESNEERKARFLSNDFHRWDNYLSVSLFEWLMYIDLYIQSQGERARDRALVEAGLWGEFEDQQAATAAEVNSPYWESRHEYAAIEAEDLLYLSGYKSDNICYIREEVDESVHPITDDDMPF